jgi:hypothetical protein
MPCWDRPNPSTQRLAPASSPDLVPDLAQGPLWGLASVAAWRQLLSLPAPAPSNPPVERTPCWDRWDAAAQRQAPAVAPSPDSVRAPMAAALAAVRRQLLSSPAPAASSPPVERTPCWDRWDAAVQRQAPAAAPSPDFGQEVVSEPVSAAARAPVPQLAPAAPNRAAAGRPCSDRHGAAARRQEPVRARVQQARLQAQALMPERVAVAQARRTQARAFQVQRSPG